MAKRVTIGLAAVVTTLGCGAFSMSAWSQNFPYDVQPFPQSQSVGTNQLPGKGPLKNECDEYDAVKDTDIEYLCEPPTDKDPNIWTLVKTVTATSATLNLNTNNCDVTTTKYTYRIAVGHCPIENNKKKMSQKPKDRKESTVWLVKFLELEAQIAQAAKKKDQ